MNTNSLLPSLLTDIDARVDFILEGQEWPCHMGCDKCCRSLARVPQLTKAEWDLLKEGLAALPRPVFEDIARGIAALANQPGGPITCPMLDRTAGACRVYAYRPVACRTYGFYVQRDKGLCCGEIEAEVDAGQRTDVVWGNHDAVDQRLAGLGEAHPLTVWFALGTTNK